MKTLPRIVSVNVAVGGKYGHIEIVALDEHGEVWRHVDGKWAKLNEVWE